MLPHDLWWPRFFAVPVAQGEPTPVVEDDSSPVVEDEAISVREDETNLI